MPIHRRDVLKLAMAAPAIATLPRFGWAADSNEIYNLNSFGNVRLLHMTDTHAQLHPLYFREPNVNIGVGSMAGKSPHLVGERLLKQFGIAPGSAEAYAFTFLDFEQQAGRHGKLGGFAHLKTLVDMMRSAVLPGRSLCWMAVTCGKAADWPTSLREPTWSRLPICSASTP